MASVPSRTWAQRLRPVAWYLLFLCMGNLGNLVMPEGPALRELAATLLTQASMVCFLAAFGAMNWSAFRSGSTTDGD